MLSPKGVVHAEAVEELFNSASDYFDSMIEDISKAKKCIDLEVYIFGMGIVGQKFDDQATLLKRQVASA